jgi:peptide/nickel transport system substrate-binding protein
MMYGITFNTYPRTPASTQAFWTEQAQANFFGYVPEVDMASKFESFRTEPDDAERQAIIAEIFGILSRDQPVDFLAMQDSIVGYQSTVEGPEEAFGANWDSNVWYFDDGSGRSISSGWVSASPSGAQTLYFPEITDGESSARVALTMDGAYNVDENNEVVPLWMDISDAGDGAVYVCELRDDLEWSEEYGSMTAEDWVFQIRQVHKSADVWDQDTPPSTQTGDWAQVENVEQTGELEFQLELATPNPDFPLAPVLWGAYCAPKALYEKYAPDAQALRTSDEIQQLQYTGNLGPYSFERWERSAEFVATRNDDYYMQAHAEEMGQEWVGAPYFERNTIRVIVEQSSRLQALKQGEITGESIPASRYNEFVEAENIDVYEVPQPFLTIVVYNQRRNGWEQLRTREVRQAISTAINKRTVTEEIYRGLAEWTHTFQPRWSEWYDDSQVTPFGVDESYDKAEARRLLQEHTSDEYSYQG